MGGWGCRCTEVARAPCRHAHPAFFRLQGQGGSTVTCSDQPPSLHLSTSLPAHTRRLQPGSEQAQPGQAAGPQFEGWDGIGGRSDEYVEAVINEIGLDHLGGVVLLDADGYALPVPVPVGMSDAAQLFHTAGAWTGGRRLVHGWRLGPACACLGAALHRARSACSGCRVVQLQACSSACIAHAETNLQAPSSGAPPRWRSGCTACRRQAPRWIACSSHAWVGGRAGFARQLWRGHMPLELVWVFKCWRLHVGAIWPFPPPMSLHCSRHHRVCPRHRGAGGRAAEQPGCPPRRCALAAHRSCCICCSTCLHHSDAFLYASQLPFSLPACPAS